MTRLQSEIKKIIPKNKIATIALMLVIHTTAYCLPKLLTSGRIHYDPSTLIDKYIPLWTPSVIIYVLAFFQWIVFLFAVIKENRECIESLFSSLIIAYAMCFIVYIVFPTTKTMPVITGSGICDRILKLIYSVDTPVNLFPSMHCMLSWFCSKAAYRMKQISKKTAIINTVFSVLVLASTVLTKQHVFVDVVGGVLVTEICMIRGKEDAAD